MKQPIAAAAALLLAACGGPMLYAEIEIPDLRVTLPSQQFPGFDTPLPANWCDPAGLGTPPCVALGTGYDLSAQVPALDQSNVTAEVRLTDVAFKLVTTGGGTVADLSGIQSATVRVGADATHPGTVVASYTRTTTSPPPTTIAITGKANVDLAPYLSSGKLPIRVEVVVDGGTSAFQADITGGFYVRVKLDYGKYLGL
jgi:hypothetical protein